MTPAFILDWFGAITNDWMNLLSLFGLAATLAGLYFTWIQANQARESAKNAETKAEQAKAAAISLREAVDEATLRIARQDLIGSMSQARQLISQLDSAHQSNSPAFVVQTLVQIVDHFSQLQALISHDTTFLVPAEFAQQLQEARKVVLKTKSKLARDPEPNIWLHIQGSVRLLGELRGSFSEYETKSKYLPGTVER